MSRQKSAEERRRSIPEISNRWLITASVAAFAIGIWTIFFR
jgi:hypothetical protein